MTDDAPLTPGDPDGPTAAFIRAMMHSITALAKAAGAGAMPDGLMMAGLNTQDLAILKMIPEDLSAEDRKGAFTTSVAAWAVLLSLSQQVLHEQAGTKGVRALEKALADYCGVKCG